MANWGVLLLPAGVDAAAHAGDGAVAAGVAQHLDGLVAVADGTTVGGLLALLPDGVTRVVVLDPGSATDPDAAERIGAVLAADDGTHVAVTAARPLADALKRVEGDTIVEGLARDGLLTPVVPTLIDRTALATVQDVLVETAAGALLAGGHAVRIVTDGDAPLTVRTSDRVR